MKAFLCTVQIESGTAGHNFLLMFQIIVEDLFERQDFRLAVYKSQINHAERGLHVGVLIKIVQNNTRVDVLLQFNDDTGSVAVRFITQIGNTLDSLFMNQLSNPLNERRLIDLIRNLGHNDAALGRAHLLNFRTGTDIDFAATCAICLRDSDFPEDNSAGRKIRTGDIGHQLIVGDVRVVDQRNQAVDCFTQIMRRHIGRHTDRDTVAAVDQQIREAGGEDNRFLLCAVEVRLEIHRIFVDVTHQFHSHFAQTGFCITHGGSAITVNRTEVALSFNERIACVEILRKTHHCIIYGTVTMGMITAHAVPDDTRTLTSGFVGSDAEFLHRVHDAAVNRLHAIPDIGKSTACNNRHRIGDEAFLHFMFQIDRTNFLAHVSPH